MLASELTELSALSLQFDLENAKVKSIILLNRRNKQPLKANVKNLTSKARFPPEWKQVHLL